VPIYEYQCKKCHHRFEKIHQKFSDERVKKCPQCGGPVEQLLSAPAVQFKGSGFYVTDYARKGSGDKSKDSPSHSDDSAKKVEASSDGKGSKSEGKSESKAETKSDPKSESTPKHAKSDRKK
jgi:putative FmdB family regulatory protein